MQQPGSSPSDNPKKLIVIVGPTAVGKTQVAIALAKYLKTEIISADSRQLFRELEIGTAKPSDDDLQAVRHHFINSHSIKQHYDAAQYGREALALIHELFREHDTLILCGGSGLYIQAALDGFDDIPAIPSEVRETIAGAYESNGITWLQDMMKILDPAHFANIDAKNPQRLMRALEVRIGTGKSISTFQLQTKIEHPFSLIKIGLELPREELYRRIDERMDKMVEAGLFNEAENLFDRRHLPALQTVGYQEIFGFLENRYDYEEAQRLLKRNSRRYAKRQITWFRRDTEIKWFPAQEIQQIMEAIEN